MARLGGPASLVPPTCAAVCRTLPCASANRALCKNFAQLELRAGLKAVAFAKSARFTPPRGGKGTAGKRGSSAQPAATAPRTARAAGGRTAATNPQRRHHLQHRRHRRRRGRRRRRTARGKPGNLGPRSRPSRRRRRGPPAARHGGRTRGLSGAARRAGGRGLPARRACNGGWWEGWGTAGAGTGRWMGGRHVNRAIRGGIRVGGSAREIARNRLQTRAEMSPLHTPFWLNPPSWCSVRGARRIRDSNFSDFFRRSVRSPVVQPSRPPSQHPAARLASVWRTGFQVIRSSHPGAAETQDAPSSCHS
jgi:hypothetical protein